MEARLETHVTIATLLLMLASCDTTARAFGQTAEMAERSCAKSGKHAEFTQSEVNTDFWRGDTVALHAICVGSDDARYKHPGLQVMMNDSVNPEGARIALVIPGYAGAKAGLQANDLIVAIDNHQTVGRDDVARYTVGASTDVQIHILRGHETLSLTAHL